MINVNMTDKAGVTLATAGKYCADNVKVTPSAEILRKDEQAKTATPTTSAQDVTPDAGKALSKVTVNPITAAIVGNLDASIFAASIVAAVEGKGVTVPDGTLLDGMAALIESIEAGGSGGGGFESNHVDIAYGSFVTDKAVQGVRVDCGFPISKDDAFMYVFGCIPIATRTSGANIAGYFANKMPSASLPDTAYGGTFYASSTSTKLSPSGIVSLDNVFLNTTGNDIQIRGYGSWTFVPTNEYFWIVVKEKNA